MHHDDRLHARSSEPAPRGSATGFELTERTLAELLHQRSNALVERWLTAPLAALNRLDADGELDAEAAVELRAGLEASLELFVVLEREGRVVLGSATSEHPPR
mgnify:CR=1 FL=1